MPQIFILVGVIIFAPEMLYWLFVGRPRQRKLKAQLKRNGLFWSIRKLEKDIYGEWRS